MPIVTTIGLTLYPPHRVDFGLATLCRAALACVGGSEARALAAVAHHWNEDGAVAAYLSVRSALDSALSALAFAPGDEVLLTAVTIDDMARLVQAHGLRAVAVDLDPATLAPAAADLEAAWTPRTRAIIVAHLFGGRLDLTELCGWARARGLVVIEDAAQALGDGRYRGHLLADITLFSFGTIKTASALGGGLAVVRNPDLHMRMNAISALWPQQSRSEYGRKVAKSVVFVALQSARWYAVVHAICCLFGTTAGALGRKLSRGFGGLDQLALLRALRVRPAVPLLRLLRHRLAHRDFERLARRATWGQRLQDALPPHAKPGFRQAWHTHWLVPVVVPDPAGLRAALLAAGFDAFGASNVVALGGQRATAMMAGLVFVPAYPELPVERLAELTAIVCAHVAPEGPC